MLCKWCGVGQARRAGFCSECDPGDRWAKGDHDLGCAFYRSAGRACDCYEEPADPEDEIVATHTYVDGDKIVIREITAREFYQPGPVNVTPETEPTKEQLAKIAILKNMRP